MQINFITVFFSPLHTVYQGLILSGLGYLRTRGPSQTNREKVKSIVRMLDALRGGNGFTICGLLSVQWFPLLPAVGSMDRNLVAGFRCQPVQNRGGDVPGDGFLSRFLWKEGFPGDPITANVSRGGSPGSYKTALGHIWSNQIGRRSKLWGIEEEKREESLKTGHVTCITSERRLIQTYPQ